MEPINRHTPKPSKMHTPSGAFEWSDEPPKPSLDGHDIAGIIIAVILALIIMIVAWKAIPEIAASVHAAEEVSKLVNEGY